MYQLLNSCTYVEALYFNTFLLSCADGEISGFIVSNTEGAYSCELCSFTCDDEATLNDHIDLHSTTKTLACSYCQYRTISELHFNRHISDHQLENETLAVTHQSDFDDDWQMIYTGPNELDNLQDNSALDIVTKDIENLKRKSLESDFLIPDSSPKQMKITKYFTDVSDVPTSPEIKPWRSWRKWRCPYCKYKHAMKLHVVKHIKAHKPEDILIVKQKMKRPLRVNSISSHQMGEEQVLNGAVSFSDADHFDDDKHNERVLLRKCAASPSLSHHKGYQENTYSDESPASTIQQEKVSRASSRHSLLKYKADDTSSFLNNNESLLYLELFGPDLVTEFDFEGFNSSECLSPVCSNVEKIKLANIHLWSDVLSCPFCKFTSVDRLKMSTHGKVKHPTCTVIICDQCMFISDSKSNMSLHKSMHHPILETIACDNCYFKSMYQKSFDKHLERCNKIASEEGYCREGRHVCPLCAFRCNNLDIYKEHLLNHVRHETLTCPQCSFKTIRKDMYSFHLQTEHQLERLRHQCDLCEFGTINENILRQHLAQHARNKRGIRKRRRYTSRKDVQYQAGFIHELFIKEEQYEPETTKELTKPGRFDISFPYSSYETVNSDETNTCVSPSSNDVRKLKNKSKTMKTAKITRTSPVISNSGCITWPCIICLRSFAQEDLLLKHFLVHASDGKMLCPTCDFSTNFFPQLQDHFDEFHDVIL